MRLASTRGGSAASGGLEARRDRGPEAPEIAHVPGVDASRLSLECAMTEQSIVDSSTGEAQRRAGYQRREILVAIEGDEREMLTNAAQEKHRLVALSSLEMTTLTALSIVTVFMNNHYKMVFAINYHFLMAFEEMMVQQPCGIDVGKKRGRDSTGAAGGELAGDARAVARVAGGDECLAAVCAAADGLIRMKQRSEAVRDRTLCNGVIGWDLRGANRTTRARCAAFGGAPRQLVRTLVTGIAIMAAHPMPTHSALGDLGVEQLPQIEVFAPLPAERHGFDEILAVTM